MRNVVKASLRQVLEHLDQGVLTPTEMTASLIWLREETTDGSVLRDVCDCVAHASRYKGLAFRHTRDLVKQMIGAGDGTGDPFFHVRVLYPIAEVREQISAVLEQQGVLDGRDLDDHRDLLVAVLAEVLDGIEILLPQVSVVLRAGPPPRAVLQWKTGSRGAHAFAAADVAIPLLEDFPAYDALQH